MTRQEYLAELRENLSSLPTAERDSALVYYEEFFEDADDDDEAIKTLGSAKSVAESIIADQNRTEKSTTEYVPAKPAEVKKEETPKTETAPTYFDGNGEGKKEKSQKSTSDKVLMIVLLVLTFPIWISILAVAFGIFVAVLSALLGIIIAFVAMSVTLVIMGLITFGTGIPTVFISPVAGVVLFAIGALSFAIGMFISIPTLWLCAEGIPALFRWIISIFRRLFGIDKGAKVNA